MHEAPAQYRRRWQQAGDDSHAVAGWPSPGAQELCSDDGACPVTAVGHAVAEHLLCAIVTAGAVTYGRLHRWGCQDLLAATDSSTAAICRLLSTEGQRSGEQVLGSR